VEFVHGVEQHRVRLEIADAFFDRVANKTTTLQLFCGGAGRQRKVADFEVLFLRGRISAGFEGPVNAGKKSSAAAG
jgi:hypothetical protein